jgi:D-glycero-D-manno-heptose 1,7-bisphosphate phosphatase
MDQALFLDRDGTLIVKHDYLSDPAQVELMPGVREALHRFILRGYRLFLFTNQSGVGRGLFSSDAVKRCNERMLDLLDLPSSGFTEMCIATESPDMPTVYRKPSPRFILEMIAKYSLTQTKTWMVGDMPCDMQAGLNAKVNAAWIKQGNVSLVPDGVTLFRNFPAFAAACLEAETGFSPSPALHSAGGPAWYR